MPEQAPEAEPSKARESVEGQDKAGWFTEAATRGVYENV